MSTTQVKISSLDISTIVLNGLTTITLTRAKAVRDEVDTMMKETKWTFFGRKPKYEYSWHAIAAMKADRSSYWGVSRHYILTKWLHESDEDRLIALRVMARTAVDNNVLIGEADHALLRKYAPENLGRWRKK